MAWKESLNCPGFIPNHAIDYRPCEADHVLKPGPCHFVIVFQHWCKSHSSVFIPRTRNLMSSCQYCSYNVPLSADSAVLLVGTIPLPNSSAVCDWLDWFNLS